MEWPERQRTIIQEAVLQQIVAPGENQRQLGETEAVRARSML